MVVTKRAAQEPCLQRQWPVPVPNSPPRVWGTSTRAQVASARSRQFPKQWCLLCNAQLLPYPHWIKSAQPPPVAQQEARGPGSDGHCRCGIREKLCSTKEAHPEQQATCTQTAQTTCPVRQKWRLPLGSDRKMSAEDPRPERRDTRTGTCMSRVLYYLHTFDRFAFGEETPKQTGTGIPTPKPWEHDRPRAVLQSPLVKCYSREQAREWILWTLRPQTPLLHALCTHSGVLTLALRTLTVLAPHTSFI